MCAEVFRGPARNEAALWRIAFQGDCPLSIGGGAEWESQTCACSGDVDRTLRLKRMQPRENGVYQKAGDQRYRLIVGTARVN